MNKAQGDVMQSTVNKVSQKVISRRLSLTVFSFTVLAPVIVGIVARFGHQEKETWQGVQYFDVSHTFQVVSITDLKGSCCAQVVGLLCTTRAHNNRTFVLASSCA